ncbi:MAG TPA: 1-acyl-sn-glycerol-3-phosphate acyltransferase [Enhygromyxa sp.]|nr:1-acyl-sn-glycerol-3-phosphate acyltransferase [Enhygromyxa sp.]
MWLGLALFVVAAPATLLAAALVDALRRRKLVALRLWCFVGVYLLANVIGQLALALVWLRSGFGRDRSQLIRRSYAVQTRWTSALFVATTRLWKLRWSVAGADAITPAPMIILVHHASLLDTLIPSRLITRDHGIALRFVLKSELLVDPCLDVAGHWLPNHFVDRTGEDSAAELRAITELAAGLEPGQGLLIYPEGTRFSADKRAQVLARLEQRDPALAARARALQHTLLPRVGGTLAMLRGAPTADLVICGHVGLGGFATLADTWSGELVGRTIHVEFWRHAAASLPADDERRAAWLYERWAELDRWIAARTEAP